MSEPTICSRCGERPTASFREWCPQCRAEEFFYRGYRSGWWGVVHFHRRDRFYSVNLLYRFGIALDGGRLIAGRQVGLG